MNKRERDQLNTRLFRAVNEIEAFEHYARKYGLDADQVYAAVASRQALEKLRREVLRV